jgi:hypothetical protein
VSDPFPTDPTGKMGFFRSKVVQFLTGSGHVCNNLWAIQIYLLTIFFITAQRERALGPVLSIIEENSEFSTSYVCLESNNKLYTVF